MTRVLILGGGGMLGHKLAQAFRKRFEVAVTFRGAAPDFAEEIFRGTRVLENIDATDVDAVTRAVGLVQPDEIVNCVGIIKRLASAQDPISSLTVNALLPHRLHAIARAARARLIHISTDCVFSGRKGMYSETDAADAEDLYGRTKFLGEAAGVGALTLRTSFIGRELWTRSGLIEWFLESVRFRAATAWRPKRWEEMISDMASDPTPYDRWRALE